MSHKIVQRLGWPGLGLCLTILLAVQTGAAHRKLEPCTIASSLGLGAAKAATGEAARPSLAEEKLTVAAEGRVAAYPGAEVVVGSEVAGRIVALNVREKSVVRKGDVLAELNSADLRASLTEAEARIREAECDARFFQKELKREQGLVARRAGTAQSLDALTHNLEAASSRHAAATAARDRLAAEIAKTRIVAPIDGVITSRQVHAGETIEAAQKLVTIVDLTQLRVEAEVDEYDAGRISLGAEVSIRAEGYDAAWKGTIEEIPDAVVGRKLRPEDPGRPIDARVLPVKIRFDEPHPFRLGQRVEVRVAAPVLASGGR